MEIPKPEFSQPGSILRMKFVNFMQYSDTEVNFGPNLNVIIGPNGTGKSTIVNGICIGLAGKPSVLGRASKITDFILLGQNHAELEIELFNSNGDNLIIYRKWTIQGKNEWRINGKKTSEKDVKETVAKLRIQVDNLCQFLPQDKVHDFSRLNSKGLLDSTIDAVGETGLKEKHNELRELQKEFDEGDSLHLLKERTYAEKVEKCDKMEDAVKAFQQKKALMEKLESLNKKRKWCEFFRHKSEYLDSKAECDEKRKRVEAAEREIAPLEADIKEMKMKITNIKKIKKSDQAERDLAAKCQIHGKKIEEMTRQLDELDADEQDRQRRIKEKQKNIEKFQKNICELEREIKETCSGEEAQDFLRKINEAKKNTNEAQTQNQMEKEKLNQKGFEINTKMKDLKNIEGQLAQLKDMENRKLEKLKEKNIQTYQAVQWLRNNKENFRGEVYEPFVVCANMLDQNHAIYIENTINVRDMTVFFFEESEDMNRFVNVMREEKGLENVAAAVVTRYAKGGPLSLDKFQPKIPGVSLKKFGFINYLVNMVKAPDPVLAYMCHQYNLHNTAVFQPSGEKFINHILDLGLTKMYFGRKFQSVSRSMYSGKIATRTMEVGPRNLMGQSLDHDKISSLHNEEQACQQIIQNLQAEYKTIELNCKHFSVALESRRNEQRKLEQVNNLIKKNNMQIERNRRSLMDAQNIEEEEQEKVEIINKKNEAIQSMLKAKGYLLKVVQTSVKTEIDKALKCVGLGPLERRLEIKQDDKARKLEESKEVRQEVLRMEGDLRDRQAHMMNLLKEAKAGTGLDAGSKAKPPAAFTAEWDKEGFPDNVMEIDQLVGELDAQIACTDNVDQNILEKYRELKEQIQDLEHDIQRREKVKQNQSRKIEQVKQEWLSGLNDLVSQINVRFSRFFCTMGFAGAVQLDTGRAENDFDNYGIKVLVKYRDHEDLQELDAHRQSGGERSVATAIYMLALQALTTVPFRCVDEINQGMDSRNERLVFDLLVDTSCQENDAQYFLLTPKLLSGLTYNPKMTVLTVHNGQDMAHHSEWNMDAFVERLGEIRGN